MSYEAEPHRRFPVLPTPPDKKTKNLFDCIGGNADQFSNAHHACPREARQGDLCRVRCTRADARMDFAHWHELEHGFQPLQGNSLLCILLGPLEGPTSCVPLRRDPWEAYLRDRRIYIDTGPGLFSAWLGIAGSFWGPTGIRPEPDFILMHKLNLRSLQQDRARPKTCPGKCACISSGPTIPLSCAKSMRNSCQNLEAWPKRHAANDRSPCLICLHLGVALRGRARLKRTNLGSRPLWAAQTSQIQVVHS